MKSNSPRCLNIDHQCHVVICILLLVLISGCNSKKDTSQDEEDNKQIAEVTKFLKLGTESQGEKYQFGDPIGVRTDRTNNIYVADRASLTIRVFNENGEFIKEIGRRGRGPSEFLDINSFEISPEEHFFILDRGNMRYTHIKKDGEFVSSEPIDFSMEWQFYPDDIDYYEANIIALYNDGVFNETKPLEEKELFYVYDRELKNKIDSFFSFSEFEDINISKFAWVSFLEKPGSFVLNRTRDELYYSPLIYHGNIYNFTRTEVGWELKKVIRSNEMFGARKLSNIRTAPV